MGGGRQEFLVASSHMIYILFKVGAERNKKVEHNIEWQGENLDRKPVDRK